MPIPGNKILSVDPQYPDKYTINKAATLIRNGGLVVFPTSTFYGLGVRAADSNAVDSVFRVKERNRQKPLLILIARLADLPPLVQSVPRAATRLINTFWPGNVTLVFQTAGVLPQNLTGNTGKIGIRLPAHPVASALVSAVGSPITGTSANLSGKGGCSSVERLDSKIKGRVDLVIGAGELLGGKGSTVVDVTVYPPQILRKGVVDSKEIKAVLKI